MDWRSRTVIVTGGAGFIGRELVRAIARLGSELYILDDLSSGVQEKILASNVNMVVSNVTSIDRTTLMKLENVDLIFHLGAPSSDVLFRENPIGCLKNTLVGFSEVTKFAADKGVKKLVYATSSSVYGDGKPPQSESTPTNPTNLYGAGKLICESIAKSHANIPTLGLRIFAGYGPGELSKGRIASVVTLFMQSLLNHKPITLFGDGSQSRDFVYIDDIVQSMIRSAEIPDVGVMNVGSGEARSFTQIISDLEDVLGLKGDVIFAPTPAGYFASTLADNTRMKSKLGILPRTLPEGLKAYLRVVGRTT